VETPELLEVLAVNAAAPFVLNGKLRGLMARTTALGTGPATSRAAAGDGDGDGDAGDGGANGDGGGGDDATDEGENSGGNKSKKEALGRAFIVNVSAMEGKFYRYKTANHPHTNMAKAALNMMTATAAADYATQAGAYNRPLYMPQRQLFYLLLPLNQPR
jgi:NAD(P)-dependent dehydrogenase (short-subunit alcohol dehydrogenase family)